MSFRAERTRSANGVSMSFRAERARSAREVEESRIFLLERLYRDDMRFLDSLRSLGMTRSLDSVRSLGITRSLDSRSLGMTKLIP
jgi:hypothetical protein